MLNGRQVEGNLHVEDARVGASRDLRAAVERCLAAGMSPRTIMFNAGLVFWSFVRGGVANPENDRRWPRDSMGGWSDEPCPTKKGGVA